MKPKELSSEIIFKCPFFEVEKKKLVYPNGHKHEYFLENGHDFVAVICKKDDRLLMVNQYRVPLEANSLEFPAGGIGKGEDVEKAAKRELLEETGYNVDKLIFIGKVRPLIARSKVTGNIYFAKITDEKQEEQNLDPSEDGLEAVWVHKNYFESLLRTSDALDSITVSAWALYQARKDEIST